MVFLSGETANPGAYLAGFQRRGAEKRDSSEGVLLPMPEELQPNDDSYHTCRKRGVDSPSRPEHPFRSL